MIDINSTNKNLNIITVPTSFILNEDLLKEGRAESFSPYSKFDDKTDSIKEISTSIQNNLNFTLISPLEYINRFHLDHLNHSSNIYVIDSLETLNKELNEIFDADFQKLRNLKMQGNGRQFAVYYHLYLLESVLYYFDHILTREDKFLAGCHYFLHVYFLEDLLPPESRQKKFFMMLKEKTKVFLEKFLKTPKLFEEGTSDVARVIFLFQVCLLNYGKPDQIFGFNGPKICFMNILFRRYFKEFFKITQPNKTIINQEIEKITNIPLINLTEYIINSQKAITGKLAFYAKFPSKSDLHQYAKNSEYLKNSMDWFTCCDYNASDVLPIDDKDIIRFDSIKAFFAYVETSKSPLKFKIILLTDLLNKNNSSTLDFCAHPSLWYYNMSKSTTISPENWLCSHFCAIDSIIYCVFEKIRKLARDFHRDLTIQKIVEKLVFGAFVHLSCIEEMLDRRSKQNVLITRVKEKCYWLLRTVLAIHYIPSEKPTLFFESLFKALLDSQIHILNESTLNLLNYKLERYKRDYMHITKHNDN